MGWSPDPLALDHVEWCVMALAMSAGLLVYRGAVVHCSALVLLLQCILWANIQFLEGIDGNGICTANVGRVLVRPHLHSPFFEGFRSLVNQAEVL